MSITIVTRAGKGSPLNATEHDANLNNLAAAIENTSTGHNHDGSDSNRVSAANILNTPAGNIVATDVQSALNELDTEKLSVSAKASLAEVIASIENTKYITSLLMNAGIAVLRNPLARSQSVALTAAASGSSGITVVDNANINFGTGNFTLVWKGSLPDQTPSDSTLFDKTMTALTGYALSNVNGYLYLYNRAGVNSYYTSTVPLNVSDGVMAEIAAVVTRENLSTPGSVVFYVNGVQLGESVAIPAGTPSSNDDTVALSICGRADGARIAGTVCYAYILNFALTAEEILNVYRNGIPESWKWGANISIVTGDNSTFASDTGWWTKGSGWSITGGKAVVSGSLDLGSGTSLRKEILTSGKKYRVQFTISDYVSGDCQVWPHNTGIAYAADGTFTQEFIATTTHLGFNCLNIAACNYKIDNVTVIEIGATLALEPEGIQPVSANSQWLDSTSNKLNATLPAAGASAIRKIDSGRFVWSTPMTDDTTLTSILPAGFELERIIFNNSTANTCTLRLGTSAGGTEMAATINIGASGFTTAVINKPVSLTADTTLYLSDTGSGWDSCSLTATLFFRRVN